MKELEFLEKQNVSPELIKRAEEFQTGLSGKG